jgi:hypothetical protein
VPLLPPARKNWYPGWVALQNPLPLYWDPEGQAVPLLPPAGNIWFALTDIPITDIPLTRNRATPRRIR